MVDWKWVNSWFEFIFQFEDNLSEQDDLDLTGDEDLLREIEEMSNVRSEHNLKNLN